MKTAIISKNTKDVKRVFTERIRSQIKERFELLDEPITKDNLDKYKTYLAELEVVFSTWGMQEFTCEEIKNYFPKLKAIYYAAGTVQAFARPFLENGIAVHSAWQANAVPVAEYVYAQILLANKGFYVASKKCKFNRYAAIRYAEEHGGNFNANVGIIGCGMIGSMVCEYLKSHKLNVMVFDPYISDEKANSLGVIKASSMAEIFKQCNVISNHLPNKDELVKAINYDLLSIMPKTATFINTGRGRQIDEKALIKLLRSNKAMTAVLDVTFPEPPRMFSSLLRLKNVVLTPHIAGSLGKEVERMAEYMIEDCFAVLDGVSPKYSVSIDMLTNMA